MRMSLVQGQISLSGSPGSFDFYISPTGDDQTGAGTLASPWSLQAFNNTNLRPQYAGKRIGILPGSNRRYTGHFSGGVFSSFYSLLENSGQGTLYQIQGSTSGTPTYVAACDASGNYSPRSCTFDCSDPATGLNSTIEGRFMGQSTGAQNSVAPNAPFPTVWGGVTLDGLVVANFVYSAYDFTNGTILNTGTTIQHCEAYGTTTCTSNNNPGAIHADFVSGFTVTDCLIHDCMSLWENPVFPKQPSGATVVASWANASGPLPSSVGATQLTLTGPWPYGTTTDTSTLNGIYTLVFSDGEFRTISATQGGTAISWTQKTSGSNGPLTGTSTNNNVVVSGAFGPYGYRAIIVIGGASTDSVNVSITQTTIYNMGVGIHLKDMLLQGTNTIDRCVISTMQNGIDPAVAKNDIGYGIYFGGAATGATLNISNSLIVGLIRNIGDPVIPDNGSRNLGTVNLTNVTRADAGSLGAINTGSIAANPTGVFNSSHNLMWCGNAANGFTEAFGWTGGSASSPGFGTLQNNIFKPGCVFFVGTVTSLSLAQLQAAPYNQEINSIIYNPNPFANGTGPIVNADGSPNIASWTISAAAQTAMLAMHDAVVVGCLDQNGNLVNGGTVGASFTTTNVPSLLGRWWDINSPWNSAIPANAFANPMPNWAASGGVLAAYQSAGGTVNTAFNVTSTSFSADLIVAPAGTTTRSWTFTYQGVTHVFPIVPATGTIATQIVNSESWYAGLNDSDRSINLYSTDTGQMYDIYPDGTTQPRGGNGPITITTASVRPLNGSGWWNQANFTTLSSGTASGACQVGGSVKPSEWTAGYIPHALHGAYVQGSGAFNLSGANSNSPDSPEAMIFPARGSDSTFGASTNRLPEGARLQLDPSLTDAQLTGMGVAAAMLPVCHALQEFGWYCMDIDGNFSAQIKFLSTNPNGSAPFIGNYPGAANLPLALFAHMAWIQGPYLTGSSGLGTGVSVTGTAGQCSYSTNWGREDGLVHVGDVMTVYPSYGFASTPGTGGLQGFTPSPSVGSTSWWAGVSYKVLNASVNTFQLGTLTGAPITSTAGTMNVYFTTNTPLWDLAQAIASGFMSS